MVTKSFSTSLLITVLCLFSLSCPGAISLNDAGIQPHTRLPRPGAGAPLPPSSQAFALGVEEKHLTLPNLDVGLSGRQGNVPVLPFSVRLLANYDLELIVDRSMSMCTRDCPDCHSRWGWCGAQAEDLANQLAPYAPTGLTLTAFAKHYEVFPNASAQTIAQLFQGPSLGQATRLAEPLADRLSSYFARRRPGSKPLLIAVITDGKPEPTKSEPAMVVQTIIDASNRVIDPRELTIVFFQIGGGDREGRLFLDDLDNNLVIYGARYDIVHVVPFERLEQVGLARALVESVQDFARAHRPG